MFLNKNTQSYRLEAMKVNSFGGKMDHSGLLSSADLNSYRRLTDRLDEWINYFLDT